MNNPYIKKLDEKLIMKSIASIEDIDRLSNFNKLVHGEEIVGRLIKTLIIDHPFTKPDHFIFIEDVVEKKM